MDIRNEKLYMNIETGSIDTYDKWFYEIDGIMRNAVDCGEVVEVRYENDEWIEV